MRQSKILFSITFRFCGHKQTFIVAATDNHKAFDVAYKQAQKEVGAISQLVSIRQSCAL